MNEKAEREAFEAARITGRYYRSTEPGCGDQYADSHTQIAWQTWQARAALTPPRQMVADSAMTVAIRALEQLAGVPGCGCAFPCRCGGEEWTRMELEGRMDVAAEALAEIKRVGMAADHVAEGGKMVADSAQAEPVAFWNPAIEHDSAAFSYGQGGGYDVPLYAAPPAAANQAGTVPDGWKIAPDEEGWGIVSPSGDGCYLFDTDSLHGQQTMEVVAIREVFRQLCSSLVYPDAAPHTASHALGGGDE